MMTWTLAGVLVVGLVAAVGMGMLLRSRAVHLWLPGYLRVRKERRHLEPRRPVHLMFCLVDHFEPAVGGADLETQLRRVRTYVERLPETLADHRDADGHPPVQTLFYPIEQCRPEHLEALRPLLAQKLIELEVHLHHDDDTAEGLRATLERAKALYARYGYLSRERETVRFGFIHGNWALDNSLPDGRWCGVNDELRVLAEAGCYADFTFPSAPSLSQPRTVNRIYYATDDPERPRSADFGEPVRVGGSPSGDLMIVQGPLCPDWRRRKFGVLPRLEVGELSSVNPPTPERVRLWVRQHIHVLGRPEWVFVKVHTHGAYEEAAATLLGEPRHRLHRTLEEEYNDGERFALHYVSARELYNIVKAAEAGHHGNPNDYRDFVLVPIT